MRAAGPSVLLLFIACASSPEAQRPDAGPAVVESGDGCEGDTAVTRAPCTNGSNEVLVDCVCDRGQWRCALQPQEGDVCHDPEGTECALEGPPPGCPVAGNDTDVCQCRDGLWQCHSRCWPRCPVVYRDDLTGQPCDFPDECNYSGHSCRCRAGDAGAGGVLVCD